MDTNRVRVSRAALLESRNETREPTVCEVKQDKARAVDFGALEKLLCEEGQDENESMLQDIQLQKAYRFPSRGSGPSSSQRFILYSGSSQLTLLGPSFQDLGISKRELPDLFSSDAKRPWWLDIQNPCEKDLRLICSAFKIHPLTVEDILNQETREKIEDYTTYYYASLWSFDVVETSPKTTYKPYNTYMVVFPSGTLSVCFSESDHGLHVQKRIELLKDHVPISSDWIFYAFL